MIEKRLKKAIRQVIKEAGSEIELSRRSGVGRAHINNIKNKDNICRAIKLETLLKIFPNMQIDFLGTGGKKGIEGRLTGMINRLSPEQRADLALAIADKYKGVVEEKLD